MLYLSVESMIRIQPLSVLSHSDAVTLSNLRVDDQGMASVDIAIEDINVSGVLKPDSSVELMHKVCYSL